MRVYVAMLAAGTVMIVLLTNEALGFGSAVREGLFNVTAILTTTGFGTSDFTLWVPAAQLLLLVMMLVGGMTGSTAGGIKTLRVQVLAKHAVREVRRSRHATAVVPVRLGARPVDEEIVSKVVGFTIIFLTAAIVGSTAVAAMGHDLVSSFSGAISAITCVGPALGEAGPASNYLVFTRPARGVLMVLMLFGRLEVFPMLFLFVSAGRRLNRRSAARRR